MSSCPTLPHLPIAPCVRVVPDLPCFSGKTTVQDESLKKLLMAWYYAGYYTGLFEGQRQADQKQ